MGLLWYSPDPRAATPVRLLARCPVEHIAPVRVRALGLSVLIAAYGNARAALRRGVLGSFLPCPSACKVEIAPAR
ncbi:hypothetical protein VTN96DRAFT_2862 [Rasamsonia emersonii]